MNVISVSIVAVILMAASCMNEKCETLEWVALLVTVISILCWIVYFIER